MDELDHWFVLNKDKLKLNVAALLLSTRQLPLSAGRKHQYGDRLSCLWGNVPKQRHKGWRHSVCLLEHIVSSEILVGTKEGKLMLIDLGFWSGMASQP